MHTRKRLMAQEADAFVALPGGIGLIDELAEITTWCQLNIHGKPIVVYNVDGFIMIIFKMIQGFVDCGFLSEKMVKLLKLLIQWKRFLKSLKIMKSQKVDSI